MSVEDQKPGKSAEVDWQGFNFHAIKKNYNLSIAAEKPGKLYPKKQAVSKMRNA